jgi:hypothetical protein
MALTAVGKQPAGEQIDTFYVPINDIFSDEPATWLREFNAPMHNGQSRGRFQEIHVLRDSYVGTWFYHLGPSRLFSAQEFQVVGGSVRDHRQDIETVASIRDYADWIRDNGGLRREVDPALRTVTQESYLVGLENTEKARRHESVSGRYMKVER